MVEAVGLTHYYDCSSFQEEQQDDIEMADDNLDFFGLTYYYDCSLFQEEALKLILTQIGMDLF